MRSSNFALFSQSTCAIFAFVSHLSPASLHVWNEYCKLEIIFCKVATKIDHFDHSPGGNLTEIRTQGVRTFRTRTPSLPNFGLMKYYFRTHFSSNKIGQPISSFIAKITTAEMGGAFVVCQKISYTHCRQSSASALLNFLTTNKKRHLLFCNKATEGSPYWCLICFKTLHDPTRSKFWKKGLSQISLLKTVPR